MLAGADITACGQCRERAGARDVENALPLGSAATRAAGVLAREEEHATQWCSSAGYGFQTE